MVWPSPDWCCVLPCRFLTYCYLLAFNAGLLLAPVVLCYDWQVGSIPLVESVWDVRNIAALLLGVVMVCLCLHCLQSLQGVLEREVIVGVLFLVFPFIPASNLFFRVGFVVAERILYMPSMGFCILVVHGLNRLCALVGRWGAAALTVSVLLLLLLFSWKTVQQNQIWLSREALFRSGIQTLPHNAKVHYNYANFLKDQGRSHAAIHHYQTALRLYPRHASAMNNLGTLTRHLEEAERYYRRALEINPQHNRALFNLGNLLKSKGKEEEAERLLRDSILYGSHFADAYSSLASLFAEQKRFAEANEIYLQGIENCPDSSDLHNNYGVFLVDTGESDRAAVHYQNAVRLKPTHYVAMVNLGRLLRSSTDNKQAEAWYKRALQVVRKVEILTPLGALYYNTGRYEEALQIYREAASLKPDSADILLALAQVLAMAGRTKEAEEITFGILSKNASCIECHRLLSAIYSKRGSHNEALDALEKALLHLSPTDVGVLAELHFSKGNQLREMNLLEQAFERRYLSDSQRGVSAQLPVRFPEGRGSADTCQIPRGACQRRYLSDSQRGVAAQIPVRFPEGRGSADTCQIPRGAWQRRYLSDSQRGVSAQIPVRFPEGRGSAATCQIPRGACQRRYLSDSQRGVAAQLPVRFPEGRGSAATCQIPRGAWQRSYLSDSQRGVAAQIPVRFPEGRSLNATSICKGVFWLLRSQGNYSLARLYYQKALQLTPGSKLLKENLAKLDRLEKRHNESGG
ncbi:hypothetical protein JZ751_016148 [Albula glossodonta]|uniref:dolichyl-phosphate-mannose--protein mannosyltransferase n=1 Tax=Albula glossodonta TaxID=121402 RepID=A0A8T2N328_9TELE|nr:hypothetical protein JZ751_016148 [Albula glossodonta]